MWGTRSYVRHAQLCEARAVMWGTRSYVRHAQLCEARAVMWGTRSNNLLSFCRIRILYYLRN